GRSDRAYRRAAGLGLRRSGAARARRIRAVRQRRAGAGARQDEALASGFSASLTSPLSPANRRVISRVGRIEAFRGASLPVKIAIPDFCLVAVVGPSSGDGSAIARRHFQPDEIVSHSSELWPKVAADRLARRELVALEASGMTVQEQIDLVRLAKLFHAQPIAIVLCDPTCRVDLRTVGNLESTGFKPTHRVASWEADGLVVERERLPVDLRDEHGPFDIIGDVHGCIDELTELLRRLGYTVRLEGGGEHRRARVDTPAGRRAIFV